MNKQEINEIKKQFAPDVVTIDRICGCYVNFKKEKLFSIREAFGQIPDEEMYKYLDIFRKTLTGRRGRNLIDLEFPSEAEESGGTQELLLQLRDSGLKDDVLLDMFYDRIIESYDSGENYYIVLVHASYDVPGMSSDGIMMEDASDNVYEYIACAICPVILSKAALGYNEKKNLIEDRFRDWVVDQPMKGFLFPAFLDRTADIHNVLYFTKKPADVQPEFVEAVFGTSVPLSEPEQRKGFAGLLQDTLGDDGKLSLVQEIHENLTRKMEEHVEEADTPLTLDKKDVKRLFEDCGVQKEQLAGFDKKFAETFGREDYPLIATNIAATAKFEMKTPDVIVKVSPDCADKVEARIIDGRKCLVIAIDDRVQVNGIDVRTL